ncbi:MAG: transporter, partial [Pirellulaceae bacterium]
MRAASRLLVGIWLATLPPIAPGPSTISAQDLEPRAYSVSPVGVNVVAGAYNFKTGDLSFDPSAPIEDGSATIHAAGFGYVRSVGFLGRSANISIALPVIAGHVEGLYIGEFAEVDRFGIADLRVRAAVNLFGAPAMDLKNFARYRQNTNVGASLVVIAPIGQYDPAKLINLGTNRWSFKPEFAISQAIGRFTLEFYAGVWIFTDNTNFFGGRTRQQERIGSTQLHVLYTIKRRMWVGFNANFYRGGRTTVDGNVNLDLQENSRYGFTLALPVTLRDSVKLSYSRGAFTTIGA